MQKTIYRGDNGSKLEPENFRSVIEKTFPGAELVRGKSNMNDAFMVYHLSPYGITLDYVHDKRIALGDKVKITLHGKKEMMGEIERILLGSIS